MRKILHSVLIALALISPAMAAEEEVQTYSDEQPQFKYLFTLKPEDGINCPLLHHSDMVKDFFMVGGWTEIVTNTHPLESSFNYIYTKISKDNVENCVFIQYKSRINHYIPISKSVHYRVHKSALHHDKWNILMKVERYDDTYEDIHELSWRFVDYSLHDQFSFPSYGASQDYYSFSEAKMKLFHKIKSSSLEEIVSRVCVVKDTSHNYSFYSAYDTLKEEECSRELVTALHQKYLHQKPIFIDFLSKKK